ncbi:MAG TPA: hypothetical protein VFM37_09360 [Pseudonocardiaceae bacterium]|nr:hypothetical protein [Pseudonocardiaceae bacterium]
MTTSELPIAGPREAAPVTRYLCTPREDLITALLGCTMMIGLQTDAWAHANIIDTIESFFTPWHAMLYGGFTALAAWTFWLALRRRSSTPRWWRDGWPAGYALGALGAVGFMAGGLADLAWHTIFGIEASLEIAFSPSHLLLAFSAILLLSSPARSWWATGQGGVRAAAGVVSLALATVFATAILTPLSAFASTVPTRAYEEVTGSPTYTAAALGIGAYLLSTVVLAVPLLLAHRRRATPGTATGIVAAVGLFPCLMYELPADLTAAAAGALAGAALADLAMFRLDAVRGRHALLRLPIAGALLAALVWSGHLLGLHLAAGLRWPAELITGTVVITMVVAVTLGCLAQAPESENRAERFTAN